MTTSTTAPARATPAVPPRPVSLRVPRRPDLVVWAGLLGMVVVVGAGLLVAHDPSATAAGLRVEQAISLDHVPVLDSVALVVQWVFEPVRAALWAVLATAVVLVVTRRLAIGVVFASVVSCGWLGAGVVKAIVGRARPDERLLAHPLVHESASSSSWPSGHTAFVAALAVGIVVVARGSRHRAVVVGASSVVVLVVAASRVYLGVHDPLDVVASIVWVVSASAVALTFCTALVVPQIEEARVTGRRASRPHHPERTPR